MSATTENGLFENLSRWFWKVGFIGRILILLRQKRFGIAESLCRKGIRESPQNYVYHDWLGKALWYQGRLAEAIQEYRVAIGLQGGAFSAQRIELINLLFQAKCYEQVIIESKKLLDNKFHAPSFLTRNLHKYAASRNMAEAYGALGDYQNAKEAWSGLLAYHKKGKMKAYILKKIDECNQEIGRLFE